MTQTKTPLVLADIRNIIASMEVGTLQGKRDRALMLTGWCCALGRSQIVSLNWGDLTRRHDQWCVWIRRSKTEIGIGQRLLASVDGDPACPATAMTEWHASVTDSLGGDPCRERPGEAVFCRISRTGAPAFVQGGLLTRMSGKAITGLVQDLACAAKLDLGPTTAPGQRTHQQWGASSLRTGLVVDAFNRRLSLPEIQCITGHESLTSLMRYLDR